MRVLSFIPALLLAAAGFVAAAPSASNNGVALFARTPDVSTPTGNIPPSAQPAVDAANKATSQIKPLNDKLDSYKSNPNADEVAGVVTEITAVIKVAVGELAVVKIDAGVDLTGVLAVVLALVAEVLRTLQCIGCHCPRACWRGCRKSTTRRSSLLLWPVCSALLLVLWPVVLAAVLDVVLVIVALLKVKVLVGVYA
ncbi:hypothetical protein JVT61DRAFT_9531 [Boletus reticuloceps]|uniref:Uncharacterized protein n=1 Tax=Boletus reticuloceps TaxID=495285 RepID=A0A8I3A5W2_9AGAM|nr:hypothetical protein JVT61DRAFT_9531 [Boletus reticuloceps]